jgi:hypothetical protein
MRGLRILSWTVAAVALAVFAASIDAAVRAALRLAGAAALLALVPFGAQVVVGPGAGASSCGACAATCDATRHGPPCWRAVRMSFPGGAVVADGLRPALFARRAAVPLRDGVATLAVRKLCHLATQGLYLGLGAALGAALLGRLVASAPAAVGAVLRVAIVVLPTSLVAGAVVLGLALFHGGLAARAQRLATRATAGRVATALARWRGLGGHGRRLASPRAQRRDARVEPERPSSAGS